MEKPKQAQTPKQILHHHNFGKYDLELERVAQVIKRENAKLVCLQFPRGLMQHAPKVVNYIENETKAKCIIWQEATFGACDLPLELEQLSPKIDLLVQFGHSRWKYHGHKAHIEEKFVE